MGHIQSRATYLIDLLIARSRRPTCPSCGHQRHKVIVRKTAGLATIRECDGCGLFFRPTGLRSSAFASWYYEHAYFDAGVATAVSLATDRRKLEHHVRLEGKTRVREISELLEELPPGRRRVCVLGCSWGYEVQQLRAAGISAFGIEPGRSRRAVGVRQLGLDLYESLAAAKQAGEADVGVVFSSHVLEHVPRLRALLDQISTHFAPPIQLHITPCVDPPTALEIVRTTVGREHPLGVTRRFWQQFCDQQGARLELSNHREELWAVVRAR